MEPLAPKNTAPTWRSCYAKSSSAQQKRFPSTTRQDASLAQDVTARMDVPSFDNSQMDGYALTAEAAERGRIFTVGREIPAGRPLQRSRSSDDLTYPIMTGAPMPRATTPLFPSNSPNASIPDLPESFGRPSERSNLPRQARAVRARRRGEDVVTSRSRTRR